MPPDDSAPVVIWTMLLLFTRWYLAGCQLARALPFTEQLVKVRVPKLGTPRMVALTAQSLSPA